MAVTLGLVIPIIEPRSYMLGSSTLAIPFEPFPPHPTGYDAGPNKVDIYEIKAGAILGTEIDVNSTSLLPIIDFTWIIFDPNSTSLFVKSEDSSLLGVHKFVLVQTFENFPAVIPFSQFDLNIFK